MAEQTKLKRKWGGARKGAGRPKNDTIQAAAKAFGMSRSSVYRSLVVSRLLPETIEWLKENAYNGKGCRLAAKFLTGELQIAVLEFIKPYVETRRAVPSLFECIEHLVERGLMPADWAERLHDDEQVV